MTGRDIIINPQTLKFNYDIHYIIYKVGSRITDTGYTVQRDGVRELGHITEGFKDGCYRTVKKIFLLGPVKSVQRSLISKLPRSQHKWRGRGEGAGGVSPAHPIEATQ